MNHQRLANALSCLFIFAVAGCDQLTATTQAVSVITASPDLTSAVGFDSQLASVIDFGSLGLSNVVGVAVGVGERSSPTSTEPPSPILDATVRVTWNSTSATLCGNDEELPDGTYAASNLAQASFGDCVAASLAYVPGATYETVIETADATHRIRVEAPSALAAAGVEFSPQLATSSDLSGLSLPGHARNTALTVDWGDAPGANDRHAFVTLGRVNFTGDRTDSASVLNASSWEADSENPVFESLPRSPAGMISLVLDAPETSAQIPASVFDTEGLYFLILTATELSTDVSSNLAIGSGGLAGRGTAFVFYVP